MLAPRSCMFRGPAALLLVCQGLSQGVLPLHGCMEKVDTGKLLSRVPSPLLCFALTVKKKHSGTLPLRIVLKFFVQDFPQQCCSKTFPTRNLQIQIGQHIKDVHCSLPVFMVRAPVRHSQLEASLRARHSARYAENGLRCQMCLFHPSHCSGLTCPHAPCEVTASLPYGGDDQHPLHSTNLLAHC